MRKILISVMVVLGAFACGDENSPTVGDVTGTFAGTYNTTLDLSVTDQAVLQLTQSGTSITGSLTTESGRTGTVAGSMSGLRATLTFTFTDDCGGSATGTADLLNNSTRLAGNYNADDCLGTYSGSYVLIKQ